MADNKRAAFKELEIKLEHDGNISRELAAEEKEKLKTMLVIPIYQAGIAKTQEEYEKNYDLVFDALDWLEKRLGEQKYLLGDRISEADISLYSVLVRFDMIYYFDFGLNRNQIKDFPNLWRYAKELYHRPEFQAATDFQRLKEEYYKNQTDIENPYHLVANGPDISGWEKIETYD